MRVVTLSLRNLSWKAFLFSSILHLFFFTAFIFVFIPLKPSFKPEFLFLGSILKQQDLQNTVAQIPSTDSWRTFKPTVSIDYVLLPNKALSTPKINKPAQSSLTKQGKKLLTKSIAGESADQTQKKRPSLEDLDFDLHLAPYKPLKLETK